MFRLHFPAVVLSLLPVGALAEMRFVHQGSMGRIIIFIHGLGGGEDSFRAPRSSSWLELMGRDRLTLRRAPPLSAYTIAALSYPAGASASLSAPQVINRLLTELEDAGVFSDYREVILIGHSLGGIIAKGIVLEANKRGLALKDSLKAVFLIAVPSTGSDLADLSEAVPSMLNDLVARYNDLSKRLIRDLQSLELNSFLEQLQQDWRQFVAAKGGRSPAIFCAFETRPYRLGKVLVPQSRAVTACDGPFHAEDADHFDIVRPESAESSIYRWVRGRIATLYDGPAPPPPPPPPPLSTRCDSNQNGEICLERCERESSRVRCLLKLRPFASRLIWLHSNDLSMTVGGGNTFGAQFIRIGSYRHKFTAGATVMPATRIEAGISYDVELHYGDVGNISSIAGIRFGRLNISDIPLD